MDNKWLRKLFLRRIIVSMMIALQVAVLIYFVMSEGPVSTVISAVLTLMSFFIVLYIINKKEKPAYRMTWVVLVLGLPVLGGLFYLLVHTQASTRRFSERLREIEKKSSPMMQPKEDNLPQALASCTGCERILRYLQGYEKFPVWQHTQTEYYPQGEAFLPGLIAALEGAEKYIFMEYFIVQEGEMWAPILEVLARKAKEGVRVRMMFDDMGCFFTLPADYVQTLASMGIEAAVFNPFVPVASAMQNNRDHRKIASIDGKIAFTGGVNLADEYINAIEKHGHWKDCAIRLEGDAAWSLTVIFLQLWELTRKTGEDFMQYYPWTDAPCAVQNDGFVLAYADSPMDTENVAEHVYLQMIETAKDYLYINTPYLIVDDNIVSALILAAKSGVDVRVVTPGKWDKKLVHITTRSYCRELVAGGVKVYEYTPGFIHSKTFVADDKFATVGTVNLDFRSLYLHFECGVWMYGTKAVQQVRDDFVKTLPVCTRITEESCTCSGAERLFQEVLRLFAPLM